MYEEEKGSCLGRIFTYLFFALGIFIIGCFVFRSCKMSDIELADDVIFNDEIMQLYEQSPEEFKVYTYGLRKRVESVEANQLLQMKYMYYIPSAKHMQVTVKYNTSYADKPTDDNLPLKLVLRDQENNVYDDFFYEHGERNGYAYIRISFANVEFSKDTEYILYVYYEKNGEEKQIGKFIMQDKSSASREIELTEKNAPALFKK